VSAAALRRVDLFVGSGSECRSTGQHVKLLLRGKMQQTEYRANPENRVSLGLKELMDVTDRMELLA